MNKSSDIAFSAAYDAWSKRTVKRNALILGILEAAPMLVTGLAIGVTAYGFASVLGFGDVVDDFTNHKGRKIIYGYEEDY